MKRIGVGLLIALGVGALLALACGEDPGLRAVGAGGELGAAEQALVPPGATVITLSFADTRKSQTKAIALLAKYGLHGTFYVNSSRVGTSSSYLSLADLRSALNGGSEVGGHTATHVDLTEVSSSTARREVCDDRVALMQMGFPVTSFDYPFSGDSTSAQQLVRDCNYNNARAAGGIRNPFGCSSCPRSETIPPQNTFLIRSPGSLTSDYDLADLQSLVTQVENSGGGWMILGFHEICNNSDSCNGTYEMKEGLLDSFLAWLAPRASRGTYVMTTQQVIGGAVKPGIRSDGGIVPVPDGGTPDAGTPDAGRPDAGTPDSGTPDAGRPDAGTPDAGSPDAGSTVTPVPLPNPSLETDRDGDNVPDCWHRRNSGSTEGGWLRTDDEHSGSWAQRARISSLSSGDRRLEIVQDSGSCAPAGVPGRKYRVSAWYKTDGRTGFVVTYRSGGTWRSWVSSADLPASPGSYVRGQWTTPALPAGATHISVALSLRSTGYLFMDDFTLESLP